MFPTDNIFTDDPVHAAEPDPYPHASRAATCDKSYNSARKHGACAGILILPTDSEDGWHILLSRWQDAYRPRPEGLEFNFVLRTAEAEWTMIRCQRGYHDFLKSVGGRPPFTWDPKDIKMHDVMLRYKNSAERTFHREYRALEAHYKSHKLPKAQPDQALEPAPVAMCFEVVCGTDEEVRELARAERCQPLVSNNMPRRPPS